MDDEHVKKTKGRAIYIVNGKWEKMCENMRHRFGERHNVQSKKSVFSKLGFF